MFSSPDGSGLFPYTQCALNANYFVLEGWSFDFEQIMYILKKYGIDDLRDNFVLIGLVLKNKTVNELVNDIRKYDSKHDWTYGLTDSELLKLAEENISYNRHVSDDLVKYGFTLYDTSIEREQVFDKIISDIKLQLV